MTTRTSHSLLNLYLYTNQTPTELEPKNRLIMKTLGIRFELFSESYADVMASEVGFPFHFSGCGDRLMQNIG